MSSPATALTRTVATVALIVGPASMIATAAAQGTLHPSGADPTAVDVAAQFPVAWLVIGLLSVLGPLVWLAGIPELTRLTDTRARVAVQIGGLLTGAGLAAGVGHLALFFGVFGTLAGARLPDADTAALAASADSAMIGTVLLIVFLVGFSLGPIVLTIGLRAAGLVAIWVPIAAIITAGADLFGGPIASVVQLVTLVLVWAPLAVLVARGDRRRPSGIRPATRRSPALPTI
ncbi:hypothetical protein GCM10022240_25820 [Microbacterium kribbense]|uniref:DUF4386 family protein n=1 Tax=Microbacterium kribbense TaxID=433645 RepID=A0ABP7GQI6_9MICO